MIKIKNKRRLIVNIINTLIFLPIIIFFTVAYLSPNECKYSLDFDTYHAFGDCRFEMGRYINKIGLGDNRHYSNGNLVSSTIVFKVDRYIDIPPYVYINGFYLFGDDKPGDTGNFAKDINSEDMVIFETASDVPYYTKLNYETGDAEFYTTLDQVSESDRMYFEGDLSFWCKIWKECYEAKE